MLFMGRNDISLDDKKRMALPARYRRDVLEECAGKLICTRHHQHECLLIYTPQMWEKVSSQLIQVGYADTQAQNVKLVLLGHMDELKMDKQGRMLIPQLLRNVASIDDELILVGQGTSMQAWSKEKFAQHMDAVLKANNEVSEVQSGALQNMVF